MFSSLIRILSRLFSRKSTPTPSAPPSLSPDSSPDLSVSVNPTQLRNVRWGNSPLVSRELLDSVAWTCRELAPELPLSESMSYLLSCMAFETAYTFDTAVKNKHSGATGLIQFMPSTAKGLGTTVEHLATLSQQEQMSYVYRYFLPYKGRLNNLGDFYLAIFYPAALGKPDSWIIARKGTAVYRQNSGFDKTGKGYITRGDTLVSVKSAYDRGSAEDLLYTGPVFPN